MGLDAEGRAQEENISEQQYVDAEVPASTTSQELFQVAFSRGRQAEAGAEWCWGRCASAPGVTAVAVEVGYACTSDPAGSLATHVPPCLCPCVSLYCT